MDLSGLNDAQLHCWAESAPSLAAGYDQIQRAAVRDTPEPDSFGPCNALAEVMVRWSLASKLPIALPAFLHEHARQSFQIMQMLHLLDVCAETARKPDAGILRYRWIA